MSRKTSTSTKADALAFATAERDSASANLSDLETALAQATAHEHQTRSANSTGDQSVSGMDLVTSSAEVERLTGLVSAARTALESAQRAEQEALADLVVDEILADFSPPDIDARFDALVAELTRLIGEFGDEIRARDAQIDTSGSRLNAAGAPVKTTLAGRLRYKPLSATQYSDTPSPGRWQIAIDGEDIAPKRFHTLGGRDECRDRLELAVRDALRANGWSLPSTRGLVQWWNPPSGPASKFDTFKRA